MTDQDRSQNTGSGKRAWSTPTFSRHGTMRSLTHQAIGSGGICEPTGSDGDTNDPCPPTDPPNPPV